MGQEPHTATIVRPGIMPDHRRESPAPAPALRENSISVISLTYLVLEMGRKVAEEENGGGSYEKFSNSMKENRSIVTQRAISILERWGSISVRIKDFITLRHYDTWVGIVSGCSVLLSDSELAIIFVHIFISLHAFLDSFLSFSLNWFFFF